MKTILQNKFSTGLESIPIDEVDELMTVDDEVLEKVPQLYFVGQTKCYCLTIKGTPTWPLSRTGTIIDIVTDGQN